MTRKPVNPGSIWRRVFGRSAVPPTTPADRQVLLTHRDQGAVALLVAIALVIITASWLLSARGSGGLVDIDTAERLEATFATDINSADWTELAQLPEIGEALARRIVKWRQQHGPFMSHDDLDRVPGIGPKTLERIRPYLQPVSPASRPDADR